jgi:hypothetical protein
MARKRGAERTKKTVIGEGVRCLRVRGEVGAARTENRLSHVEQALRLLPRPREIDGLQFGKCDIATCMHARVNRYYHASRRRHGENEIGLAYENCENHENHQFAGFRRNNYELGLKCGGRWLLQDVGCIWGLKEVYVLYTIGTRGEMRVCKDLLVVASTGKNLYMYPGGACVVSKMLNP